MHVCFVECKAVNKSHVAEISTKLASHKAFSPGAHILEELGKEMQSRSGGGEYDG